MSKATIRDVEVSNRRVLVRVDFNIPLDEETGAIIDDMSDSTALVWSSHKTKSEIDTVQAQVTNLDSTLSGHMSNMTIHTPLNDSIQTYSNLWSALKIKQTILANAGGGGSGDLSVARDTYADLLNSTAFENVSFDSYDTTAYIDIVVTDMIHNDEDQIYEFNPGDILQSVNIFDPASDMTSVVRCMISIDYEDTGTPTIQATADGGVHWDSITLNQIHDFSFPGNDLRIRFTGGGTGTVSSWGILYNYDYEAVTIIPTPITFEHTTNLNNHQFTGDYIELNVTENSIGIGATLSTDVSGDLIESTADSTSTFILCQFLALETGTGNKNVLMKGLLKNESWSFTPGMPIYLSPISGQMTQTQPSNPGEIIQVIGYAITSNIINFNPDKTWLELS